MAILPGIDSVSFQIAWRCLRRHPSRKRVAFSTVVSIAGVALGVSALVVVMGVLDGLEHFITESVVNVDASLAVLPAGTGVVPDDPSFIESLLELPEVASAVPYIQGEAIARLPARNLETGCLVRGVPTDAPLFPGVDSLMAWGSCTLDGTDGLPGVIMGLYLAEQFMHASGDTIVFFPPRSLFSGRSSSARAVLTGAVETGLPANDRNLAWVPLHVAARMFLPGGGLSGIQVTPSERCDEETARKALEAFLPDSLMVMTWKQRNPALAASMQLERLGSMAALLLITLVATFNIMGTVARSVVERRRDIAVLRAMGGSDALVARIFLWEGVFVGLTGALLGVALGLLGCHILSSTGLVSLPDVYSFHDNLPVRVSVTSTLIAALAAVAMSILSAMIPAGKAASMDPVAVLRK